MKQIQGVAKCFDDEHAAYDAIMGGDISAGDVVVVRYEGPRGSPGMPEMLSPGGALVGRGLSTTVPPPHLATPPSDLPHTSHASPSDFLHISLASPCISLYLLVEDNPPR